MRTAGILAAALLALALAPAPAAAVDTVVKTDGTRVEGRVIQWSPRSVRIVTTGLILDLPASTVAEVRIPGAEGCEQAVVETRGYLHEGRHREAADSLAFGLQQSPNCQGLGETALELLSNRDAVLEPQVAERLAAGCAMFPEVNAILLTGEVPLSGKTRAAAGTNGLLRAEGELFETTRAGLLRLLQQQLGAAGERQDVAGMNAALVAIAELFLEDGTPISTREQYQANRTRSEVERLRHAVNLIPLPARLAEADTSLLQLMSLGMAGMQSAADAANGRLERYFFEQASMMTQRFQQYGDYPAYTRDVEEWKAKLPPQIAIEQRIQDAATHMNTLATREAEAHRELLRLRRLAESGSRSFVEEIDSQLIRFETSPTWSKAVVGEMIEHRRRIASGSPAPAPEPAEPLAAPSS